LNLDLVCVESFTVLAAERHFGRAARHLSLSASALSKRIDRLERSVGTRLIERDTGGFLELTPAGVRFLAYCDPLLKAAHEARQQALGEAPRPFVRLGVPGSPTDHLPLSVWRLVSLALSQLLPRCRLELHSVPYAYVEESLLKGWVDVLLSVGTVDHPDLTPCQLASAGRVLLVAKDHELASNGTTTVADVADLVLIREPTAPPHWMAPWLLGDLLGARDIRAVDVSARTLSDVKRAVQTGIAVTVASASLVPRIPHNIAALPILDAPSTPIYAVRRNRDERDSVLALLHTFQVLSATLDTQQPHGTRSPLFYGWDRSWKAWSVDIATKNATF
jgi:DNA-binding transcriptional LysR family regulator